MRVIAGKKRGTKLFAPKDDKVRPTTDRVKEAIFGTLTNFVPGANVLDLFCGSGALGIEAWSRGADYIILSDKSLSSIELAKRNLAAIGNPPEIKITKKNCFDCIKQFKNIRKFDIVFLDPPYNADLYIDVLKSIVDNNILANSGIIVSESDTEINYINGALYTWKQKKYGKTIITFFKLTKNEETN